MFSRTSAGSFAFAKNRFMGDRIRRAKNASGRDGGNARKRTGRSPSRSGTSDFFPNPVRERFFPARGDCSVSRFPRGPSMFRSLNALVPFGRMNFQSAASGAGIAFKQKTIRETRQKRHETLRDHPRTDFDDSMVSSNYESKTFFRIANEHLRWKFSRFRACCRHLTFFSRVIDVNRNAPDGFWGFPARPPWRREHVYCAPDFTGFHGGERIGLIGFQALSEHFNPDLESR